MPLDPRIPLIDTSADIPGAFQRGLRFREQNRQFGENQRFSDIIQQQGQGAAAGDPGAIRAIAGVDPGLAQNLQQGALKNRAGKREEDLFEAKRALAIMSRIRTPEEWDRIAAKLAPDLVGQFDKREQIMAGIRDTILALGDDEKSALFQRAVDGGLTPGTPAFQQFMLRGGKPEDEPRQSAFAEKVAALESTGVSRENAIEQMLAGKSRGSVSLPDGTVIDFGGGQGFGGAGEVSKVAQSKIEANLFGQAELFQGLQRTEQSFEPRFLEVKTRFGAAFANIKDKFGAASPEDKQLIVDFAAFKRESIDTMVLRLKALSGAAVNPQEFERITKTLPNPGTGIFDGDGPLEFKTKMDGALRATRFEIMRQQILRQGGFDPTALIGSERDIINRRAEMLEAEARARGVTDQNEIDALVDNQIRQELGL